MPSLLDNLQQGGIYSLNIETSPTRLNLISQALCSNLRRGIHCTFITPLPGAEFLARCEPAIAAQLLQYIASGQLLFFGMIGDYAKNIFRFGAQRFLNEFLHFKVPKNSFILCDQADSLFTLQDQMIAVDQAKIYRQWMAENNCTALFLFLRTSGDSIFATNYQAITDYFSGAANFSLNKNVLELFAEFWRSPEGSLAARLIHLQLNNQGLITAAPTQGQASLTDTQSAFANGANYDQANQLFTDENDVYFMGEELAPFIPRSAGKSIYIADLSEMLRTTAAARAATLIITYDKNMTFRELIEAVHTLRVTLGNRARLIVRESGLFLRYYNELLLLKIGANLIIHDNVALARIPLLLESARGQVYKIDTKFNFDEAIESILPSRKKGYLTPQFFCDEVDTVLIQANALSVPCVLVVLRHPPGIDLITSIQRFRLSRNGDLITADATYCYIFLHACPEANFRAALTRLTGGNTNDATEDKDFFCKPHFISSKIDQLRQLIKHQNMPDLTKQITPLSSALSTELGITTLPATAAAITASTVAPITQNAPIEITEALPAMIATAPVAISASAVKDTNENAEVLTLVQQPVTAIHISEPQPTPNQPVHIWSVTQDNLDAIPNPASISSYYQAPAPRAHRKQH
jgi:cellulose biosynthesis protein BcsE